MRLQGLQPQVLELITLNASHSTPGGLLALEDLFQTLHWKVIQRVVLVIVTMERKKGYACSVTEDKRKYHRMFQSLS